MSLCYLTRYYHAINNWCPNVWHYLNVYGFYILLLNRVGIRKWDSIKFLEFIMNIKEVYLTLMSVCFEYVFRLKESIESILILWLVTRIEYPSHTRLYC